MRSDPSAFPIPLDDRPGAYQAEPGMSLRTYFAAAAMQGLLAGHVSHYGHDDYWSPQGVAELACSYASALLLELGS